VRLAKLSRLLPAVMVAPLSSDAKLDDYLMVECQDIDQYEQRDAESLTAIVTAHGSPGGCTGQQISGLSPG